MTIFRSLPVLKQAAKEANPTVSVSKGSPVHDLWLSVVAQLLEPFYFDLEASFGDGYSIIDYDLLDNESMDTKMENLLVSRIQGSEASQIARVTVDTLQDYTFGEGEIIAFDASGVQFVNSSTVSISKETLSVQRSGLAYYFDAEFISDEKVSDVGPIISIDDSSVFSGFISIQGSESSISDGSEEETNEGMYFRSKDAVSARSLVTKRGTAAVIRDNFGLSTSEVVSIGMGDPEMMRDIPLDDNGDKIVNLHMGGKTDVFIKTRSLKRKEIDFINLSVDSTRIVERSQAVKLNGTNPVFVGRFPVIRMMSLKSLSGSVLDMLDYNINLVNGTINPLVASSDTVIAEYSYNPITIDIRETSLSGRESYTIEDLVLCRIVSIEEIDPGTGSPNGVILNRNGGFGQGGFGLGGFGVGEPGDWGLEINRPHERFSMIEESWIEFETKHTGKDVRVTIDYAPEFQSIHGLVTQGDERNTAAGYLPRNFIPAFVNGTIDIEVSESNEDAPDSESAKLLIESFIDAYIGERDMELDKIIEILFENDIYGLNKCFEMNSEIHHVNGSVEVVKGADRLTTPNPVLSKDTNMPVSKRIVRYYPGDISVNITQRT